jgi:hypothetical protein
MNTHTLLYGQPCARSNKPLRTRVYAWQLGNDPGGQRSEVGFLVP